MYTASLRMVTGKRQPPLTHQLQILDHPFWGPEVAHGIKERRRDRALRMAKMARRRRHWSLVKAKARLAYNLWDREG